MSCQSGNESSVISSGSEETILFRTLPLVHSCETELEYYKRRCALMSHRLKRLEKENRLFKIKHNIRELVERLPQEEAEEIHGTLRKSIRSRAINDSTLQSYFDLGPARCPEQVVIEVNPKVVF